MTSAVSKAYWAGVLLALSILSLLQDFLGKEGVIAYVQEHWVAEQITVPLALLGLITAGWMYRQACKQEKP